MIGGIIGDIVGAAYEKDPIRTTDFPLFSPHPKFTDDTVLSVAVASSILTGKAYADSFREHYLRNWEGPYGDRFKIWVNSWDNSPSDSYGNGAAMRVAPVAWAFSNLKNVLREAERSAKPTHNSPEGIRSARAVAAAVFWARTGREKTDIRTSIEKTFGYDLSESLTSMRTHFAKDDGVEKTVVGALTAFLHSTGYEDAIRKAVSLGWDADTIACITGGIAEAFYGGVPSDMAELAMQLLPGDLKGTVQAFRATYCVAANGE